mgnify:CR=1 FL=1
MILFFLTLFTSLCFAEDCAKCHAEVQADHFGASCTDCHAENEKHFAKSAVFSSDAEGCLSCHNEYDNMLNSKMHTRADEVRYVSETFDSYDSKFFEKNCSGCHVSTCSDCHGTHQIEKPITDTCIKCHNGHATGTDYTGYALRPPAEKYQRGKEINGEHYLKMLPDVHFEKGMNCADCHSMKNLSEGKTLTCESCHKVSRRDEHLTHKNLKCESCHSAWGHGEYGTTYMCFDNSRKIYDQYAKKLKTVGDSCVRSSLLNEYREMPIGVDADGKISPLRPFNVFFTVFEDNAVVFENKMISNSWAAYSPHTTQRGVRGCFSCHENDKRLMVLQNDIYDLKREGLDLKSFWNKEGQRVYNGSFLNDKQIETTKYKTDKYKKMKTGRWQKIIKELE